MNLITDIERIRGRCCLVLDSGKKYWLYASDLRESDFAPGQEVDEEELEHFVLLHQYPRALNDAVSMLARRPCSTGEIRRKLSSKRYSNETMEMVLYKLSREKLINDREFSDQWVQYRIGQKYGKRRIYQELRGKGVSEEDAREALEQMDEDESMDQAVSLAVKTLRRVLTQEEDARTQLQKAIQSLVRRGYDWDTAKSACEQALRQLREED